MLEEKCDGNRNLLHACISACCPVNSKETESENIYEKETFLNLLNNPWAQNPSDSLADSANPAGVDDDLMTPSSSKTTPGPSMPSLTVSDPSERKSLSLMILRAICDNQAFAPKLRGLLAAKDSNGSTPFMLAVSGRAYQAALVLFDIIYKTARDNSVDVENEKKAIMQMIFPRGSNPDDSPLHVLCYNDTCSFTWTGTLHINQDIFECRTCGLTGSLCCCTECARVCHKGHDCKLKHTSPTAYCDCWEKCKCKALKAGHQTTRFELLVRLIGDTDLVNIPNGRGENLLLFLLQTVRRQVKEQKQWARARPLSNRKTPLNDVDTEVPDHDLEPPKFGRRALERLLNDWAAVRAMILTGHKDETPKPPSSSSEETNFMQFQGHTTHLDKFTYCLLVKLATPDENRNVKHKQLAGGEDEERKALSDNMIHTLIGTLIRELYNDSIPGRREEAIKVARRFVASVVRIFVVLAIELAPSSGKRKQGIYPQPIAKCLKVFESLLPIAVCELCDAADALMLPVRLNYVKPTAPFPLTPAHVDACHGCEEMFEIEPLQRHQPQARPTGQAPANEDDDETEEEGASGIGNSRASGSASTGSRSRRIRSDLILPSRPDPLENEGGSEREEGTERSETDNERGGDADGAESDIELDLLAESDSDSDDARSATDAHHQRSLRSGSGGGGAVTSGGGANGGGGSDAEDSSGDSSPGDDDDDESEAAETDESYTVDLFPDDQLERRGGSSHATRHVAPHNLQWAVRSGRSGTTGDANVGGRGPGGSSGGPGGSGSSGSSSAPSQGLIYIDPTSLRRGAPATGSGAGVGGPPSLHEPVSLATTNTTLARAFSVIIRHTSSLLALACDWVRDGMGPAASTAGGPTRNAQGVAQMGLNSTVIAALLRHVDARLQTTWDWLLSLMDSTEAQLRYGWIFLHLLQLINGLIKDFVIFFYFSWNFNPLYCSYVNTKSKLIKIF